MKKIIERNVAEIIIVSVFLMCFSSCGIQFGDYERYKQVNKSSMCQEEVTQEDYYVDCCNCDEID